MTLEFDSVSGLKAQDLLFFFFVMRAEPYFYRGRENFFEDGRPAMDMADPGSPQYNNHKMRRRVRTILGFWCRQMFLKTLSSFP